MIESETLADRCRALGRARLEAMQGVSGREDWEQRWKPPAHAYPFRWGTCWTQCTQYCVEDFAAEAGFLLEILGLPSNAFGPGYAMFTSPDRAFFLSIVGADEDNQPTPPESLDLGFMIQDLPAVAVELEQRGVVFEQPPAAVVEGSPLLRARLRTPAGIPVSLWSMPEPTPDA